MIIGTAGHVDHGKTALVKSLTGVDADRLAEEKRRGITIDLGYAYAEGLGFVDVPGHERFVHTMLAGATGIDAALLVVAADDGVMPQTREHVQILDLLGIDRGVVAVSKADLAPDRLDAVTAEAKALLAHTGLRGMPVLPVSSVTGGGITALRACLRRLGERPRDSDGYPRLAVDRVFTLSGVGLVVTGTLVAGSIRVEDRLVVSPSGLDLRVRGLHAQNRPAATAQAGQRVALNVTGPRLSKAAIARGDWVLHPDAHAPTSQLDVRLRLLAEESRPLRASAPLHLHLGAADVPARVDPLEATQLEPGGSALVRLTTARAIGALTGDRLVLRDAGASRTIGGGFVVDPFPPLRKRRAPERLAQLAALEAAEPVSALRGVLGQAPGWTDRSRFLLARNLRPAAHQALMRTAPAVPMAELAVAPSRLDALRSAITDALAAHHRTAPDEPGLQPGRLRLLLPGRLPPSAFRALTETLLRRGAIEQDGPWLRLPAHRATLSPRDERTWEAVRRCVARERFRPPRTRDLARLLGVPETAMRETLKRLQRMGRLVEVAHDHFFLRETIAEMAGIAAAIAAADPANLLTAAALRDRLDNGRKVAIHVLEFFDRSGVTIRQGDQRRVRPDRVTLFGEPPPINSARLKRPAA